MVEDDATLRRVAVRTLQKAGYTAVEAGDVQEAREAWEAHHPEVTLLDLDLPGERGSALLDERWARELETVIIVVTGTDDIDNADNAFAHGAYGYVVKPYTRNELLMQVKSAIRRRELEHAVADQVHELQRKVLKGVAGITRLRSQLETRSSDPEPADEEVIRHLSSAIKLRDDEPGLHIERVSLTAAALADWCGASFDPAPAIRLAAAMHDVGKIGVPDWVVLKPGRLTPAEKAIVESHCELGHALLDGSDSPILNLAASVALNHHERWDGGGYPNRREGDDIPLEARITSVVDVFDTLTSNGVHRAALPVDTAVDIMVRERGGLFDPALLDVFLERLDDVFNIAGTLADPPAPRITRVVIVDKEHVFVDGLTHIVHSRDDMRVIGTAGSVGEAIDVVDDLRPDVVLSAFHLPGGDGARLIEHVLAQRPETKVIILTGTATPEVALRCISAGCSGFVGRTASGDDVTSAIRRVHDGEVVIPPALLPEVVSGLRRPAVAIGDDIAPREREVLGHLAQGLSLPEICTTMSISLNTGRNHTQKVIEKLGAHSKLEAVVIALRENLIELS